MDGLQNNMFIGLLLEEDHDRNFLRVQRRHLRDEMNPFDMPDFQFIKMFRLDKQSTINLINAIIPHILPRNSVSIDLTKMVLLTLNFVGCGSFQNSVGANTWVSVSQSTVSRILHEICSVIANHLFPVWVKFPTTNDETISVKENFYRKYGIRGVTGAIDGTHVEILAPPNTDVNHPPFTYINRKGKHSINVMLISDANANILACNARFPGSVHDAAIWQVSTIRNYLREKFEEGNRMTHLIGDSGYPLEPWLFTPFLNPQNQGEEAFNNVLTSARNVIERTNGILKGRFRCLSRHRVLMYHPEKAANIIYTCCVLHNIAQHADLVEVEIENDVPENHNIDEPVADNGNTYQLGQTARANYIRNNFNFE